MPLFGLWAYGFWQSKNRYTSQAELLEAARQYRSKGIPIDNVVLDWFWWTKMGSHIFTDKFPDPKAMVDTLHNEHLHVMLSVWPFFQPGTANFEFKKKGEFIYNIPESSSWMPGASLYDAFSADGRARYWSQIKESLYGKGFDAWWQDVTEPETLDREENALQTADTAAGKGSGVANLFPLMTTKAVYEGQRAESEDRRVFLLSRSGSAGMQRNAAAAWSGDLFSTWEAFRRQIPAGLNYSISSLPYWTTDIGGMVSGNPDDPAYRELFLRWFEYGTFCPIFRVHGTRDGNRNELWSYGPEAQRILASYDRLRYRLLPYIYSTAWQVSSKGSTMMRPLVMDFRTDENAESTGDQFLFGPSIMVSPITHEGERSRHLYLPGGTGWTDFWTGTHHTGGGFLDVPATLAGMPLSVRDGSILPLGPDVQYAAERPPDPIELRIYPGADGRFTLYEDEGDSYRYEHGIYATIRIDWDDRAGILTLGARDGSFPGMLASRTFRIVWVRPGHGVGPEPEAGADRVVTYDGRPLRIARE